MNLDPLLYAPLAVKVHLATVVPAFAIGTWQIFLSRKGSVGHRTLGYVYLGLVTVTAIDALFIHSLMPKVPVCPGLRSILSTSSRSFSSATIISRAYSSRRTSLLSRARSSSS